MWHCIKVVVQGVSARCREDDMGPAYVSEDVGEALAQCGDNMLVRSPG